MAEVPVTFLPRDTDVRKGYSDAMRGNPPSKRVPMTGNGMGKGMTNKGMKSGTSMNNGMSDKDYLGFGFDAAVRVGVDRARDAFMKRISNLDSAKKQILAERFENEIASQKSLQMAGRDGEKEVAAYRDAASRGEKINYQKARMRMNNLQPKRATPVSTPSPAPKPTPTGTDRYYGEGGI
jgi:hypothetical protein